MSDPSVKTCDTYPPPRGLAARVGGRQLDALKKQPGSNSPIIDHPHHPSHPATDSANVTMSTPHPSPSTRSASSSTNTTSNNNSSSSSTRGGSNSIGTTGEINVPTAVSAPRHLCVRHQRSADEGTNLILQESLHALPIHERQMINTLWSMFSSSPHANRAIILQGILTMCCSNQLSLLSEQVPQLLRIDPFFVFPREISLRVLKYLDATSLARAAQVSRGWRTLADDNILWRNMCEQHIEKKCRRCGVGLPLLEKRRCRKVRRPLMAAIPSSSSMSTTTRSSLIPNPSKRRSSFRDQDPDSSTAWGSDQLLHNPNNKRRKLVESAPSSTTVSARSSPELRDPGQLPYSEDLPPSPSYTRPWKEVFSERLEIERNWRLGRYSVTTLRGHTDGVMCLQLHETLTHPAFPVLITGSYDRTARVWNLETGQTIGILRGHTRAIRALQFDEVKLITASMDRTLRVWNWRTGVCVRVLEGHSEGVVSLTFYADLLASGSVDTTVKVWNLRKGDCFTLRGHEDWVNNIKIWDPNSSHDSSPSPRALTPSFSPVEERATSPAEMCDLVGKMLFSASDDCTIRLWDLGTRACVRQFKGHVGQVQSIKMIFSDVETVRRQIQKSNGLLLNSQQSQSQSANPQATPSALVHDPAPGSPLPGEDGDGDSTEMRPLLISGSLDNTLKLWDVETGQDLMTYFGHIEGVWAVASDKLRFVSASHDRTVKIWDRENDKSSHTLVGHRGAVTCLDLADDKIVSGSDDSEIRVWSFSPTPTSPEWSTRSAS